MPLVRDFLPVSREDMEKRGWDRCDFVYITGDAYVDHSSFGTAIISRVLESRGYRVGIISQPDWKDLLYPLASTCVPGLIPPTALLNSTITVNSPFTYLG